MSHTSHPRRLPTGRPRRRVLAGCVLTALAGLAACSGGEDTAATTLAAPAPTTRAAGTTTTTAAPTTTKPSTTVPTSTTTTSSPATTTTSSTSTTTTTTIPPVPRQPLTGVPLASEADILPRPALVVKIDNASPARNRHNGLAVADIVFEEIVEGDITRFAAVFHSRDSDPVGPIRSGRSQDVDLLTALNRPLFAWSGGNPTVERAIANSTFVDLNPDHTPAYYRGPGSAPHNLYSGTPRLWQEVPFGHPGPPAQQFAYLDDGETFTGDPVAGVDARVGGLDVSWDWSAENAAFMRSQAGRPHLDQQHGPIGAANVILMVVEYFPDPAETRSPMALTLGNGPAYIFSDGKVIEARWGRYEPDQPIRLQATGTGEVIPINPGNTWVELMRAGENPNGDINWPTAEFTIRYAG
jgi:hypothetical protein